MENSQFSPIELMDTETYSAFKNKTLNLAIFFKFSYWNFWLKHKNKK